MLIDGSVVPLTIPFCAEYRCLEPLETYIYLDILLDHENCWTMTFGPASIHVAWKIACGYMNKYLVRNFQSNQLSFGIH